MIFLNRSHVPAPTQKPSSGCTPWPTPMQIMLEIIVTFIATPMPATAISPYAAIRALTIICETLINSDASAEGTPIASTRAQIFSFMEKSRKRMLNKDDPRKK